MNGQLFETFIYIRTGCGGKLVQSLQLGAMVLIPTAIGITTGWVRDTLFYNFNKKCSVYYLRFNNV